MTNLEKFCNANPTDKRVVRLMKAMSKSLAPQNNIGRLLGELMREADEVYS